MVLFKSCKNGGDAIIVEAVISSDRIYLLYDVRRFSSLGNFDGTQTQTSHLRTLFLNVLDTSGNQLFGKEIGYTDSINSFFYFLPQMEAGNNGEIFLMGSYSGYWQFQNTYKYSPYRKNKYDEPRVRSFVAKLDKDGNIVWINDSFQYSAAGTPKSNFDPFSKLLFVNDGFSDTLFLPNGNHQVADKSLIANARENYTTVYKESGQIIRIHHLTSSYSEVNYISKYPSNAYRISLGTKRLPIKVDGDSLPSTGNEYFLDFDSAGKLVSFQIENSMDGSRWVQETEGNKNRYLSYGGEKSFTFKGDSFVNNRTVFCNCIWVLDKDKILTKLLFRGSTPAYGTFLFDKANYSYFLVSFIDSCLVNDLLIKGNLGISTAYIIRIPLSYISGIDINKPKKSSNASITTRLNLFPNPAKAKVTASWQPGNQYPTQISICDGMGNALLTQTASAFTNVVSFNTSNLKPGLYFVLFENKLWKDGRTLLIQE